VAVSPARWRVHAQAQMFDRLAHDFYLNAADLDEVRFSIHADFSLFKYLKRAPVHSSQAQIGLREDPKHHIGRLFFNSSPQDTVVCP
jgi:hypothetical protein